MNNNTNRVLYNNINQTLFIPYYISKKKRINKLVLSGGGIKGISFIGIIKALDELCLLNNIKTYAATSIGTIICFLVIIGYSYKELIKITTLFDFNQLYNFDINNLITNYGLNNGNSIVIFLQKLLQKKQLNQDITLLELFKITNKKFIITTTNINKKICEYLSYKTYPDLQIIQAIRMSISLPFIFTPIKMNNYYYIDGGCSDNFPINIFKHQDKILGIYIDNDNCDINTFEDYGFNIINTLISSNTTNSNIIKLIINIKITKFNISDNQKQELIKMGYEQILNYFNI